MTRLAALFVGLMSFACAAAEAEGAVRAWVGPGFDSNAQRDFISPGGHLLPDGFLFGLLAGEGRVTLAERLHLEGAYEVAGRLFVLVPAADTVVQGARVKAMVTLLPSLELGVVARARDRRGAGRDYSDLAAGGAVGYFPSASVSVRLEVSAHRFIYWPGFGFSWSGPDGTLSARYQLDRHHSLSVFGQFNPRAYNAPATLADGTVSAETRRDSVLGAGLSWSYRGPFHLSAGYSYFDQTSNSYGETIRRHQLSLTAGVQLPWELTVLATGTLQLASYPDGVYLAPELTVAEDGEYGSSAVAKVTRPLGKHVELDVRYGFYFNQMPSFQYVRHVVTAGVAVAF